MLFRTVTLPPAVTGVLYLHSLPGRYEPLATVFTECKVLGISTIICLVPQDEISVKSPDYAQAIENHDFPCRLLWFPIADFGVPDDPASFVELVRSWAELLRQGHKMMLHCAAGIGRTGTAACCLALELGWSLEQAVAMVSAAGAGPERPEQEALVRWYADLSNQQNK